MQYFASHVRQLLGSDQLIARKLSDSRQADVKLSIAKVLKAFSVLFPFESLCEYGLRLVVTFWTAEDTKGQLILKFWKKFRWFFGRFEDTKRTF